ncbi:MAG: hypothetical protein H7122_07890 [Chitinophagaceae bacterium]|nr:hypothetical protein [Chitinophagaceae bacterium]
MQTRKQTRLAVGLLAMAILSVTLFSFSLRPGGDHFEVYINKKLVFQQIVSQPSSLKNFSLDESNKSDRVEVFYSHCGKIGSKRTITIKDGKNTVKQWRFSDVGSHKFMSIGAKDILAFQNKNADRTINLYYSSEELPEGRLLASITLSTDSKNAMP